MNHRIRDWLCAGLALFVLAAASGGAQGYGGPEAHSLASVYQRAVRDTNGDGLADDIVARVILPETPSLEDVQAAGNIAARIGYETTAASLPVTLLDSAVGSTPVGLPILVGNNNRFVAALVAQGRVDLGSLSPGQGLVALVPDAVNGRPGLVVAGADDAGTLAASLQVAARLPHLWNKTGISLDAIERSVLEYLADQGVSAEAAAVTAIAVDAERRGLLDLRIRVEVGDRNIEAGLDAFRALDAEHRFGRGGDTLDFAAVRSTTVEVASSGNVAGEVAVRRIGANWRTLVSLPPDPPALGEQALAELASLYEAPPAPPRPPACVGCPAYMVDGMLLGGGGGFYAPAAPGTPAPARWFDLAEAYTINGWFGDRYRDLLPDSMETRIIVGGSPREAVGAAHVAARLGLESTGITLPLVRGQDSVRDPRNEPGPILVGRDNALVRALAGAGRLRLDGLGAGEGVIEAVPRAFGNTTATVVAGADPEGADAASLYLASRLPYLWRTRPGDITLDDVKADVAGFLGGRSGAGQAANALAALDGILDEVQGAALETFQVKLLLDDDDPRLAAYLRDRIAQRLGAAEVSVETEAVRSEVQVFREHIAAEWEGDEFWSRFRNEVLPRVHSGDVVEIDAWLSEAPAVRSSIADAVAAELREKGVARAGVRIHSAYKQGLFWITEQLRPQLESLPVASLRVKVRAAGSAADTGERVRQHPARWIKALYPADEILARETGVPVESFVVEQVDQQDSIYRLEAIGSNGQVLYAADFDPHIVEHDYLHGVPGTGKVQVETGHLSVRINGESVLNTRIATDLERMRDAWLARIMPRVREYVLEAGGGVPGAPGPWFRDLVIEASVSEPDYELSGGVEHVSAAEALQAELSGLTNAALAAAGIRGAGRIIPFVQTRDGQPGQADVTLTRNAAPHGRMEVSYRRRGEVEPRSISRDLRVAEVGEAAVTRVVVRADGVSRLRVEVPVADEAVAGQMRRAVQDLQNLHHAGIFSATLSYEHVDALEVLVGNRRPAQALAVRNTGASRRSNAHSHDVRPKQPLVTWDREIGPDESEEIIRKLSYYPAITAYRKARSYEGRDISVLELTAPPAGRLVSMAKLSAYKPTAMIVGRQHGNEPSSTSFILGLAERLATDPELQDIARHVNVALLPIMNPDGAALAGEIRARRPMDVAAPGYLSATAQDVTVARTLPESVVDPYLWRRWLPDIYLNAHGATSHEVVQPLNNHVPTQAPTYAFRRGWFSLAFRVPRDPRYRDWERAALALRDAVAHEINADDRNRMGNLEDYGRFIRWGHRFAPHLEPLEIHNDVMLFYSDQGSGETLGIRHLPSPPPDTAEENRTARIGDWPMVTLDGGTFEAADEGARGELFELAVRNGYAAALAHLKYLRDGRYQLDRIEEDAPGDGAMITTVRVRPVLPPIVDSD